MKRLFWGIGFFAVALSFAVAQNIAPSFNVVQGNLFYFSKHKDQITDTIIDKYALEIDQKNYDKYRGDEFEWSDRREEYRKDFLSRLESISSVYFIVINTEIGEYDFQKGGFPLKFEAGTYFILESEKNGFDYYNQILPQINLFANDLQNYTILIMAKDAAKAFLNARKSASGNIDRSIKVILTIELIDYSSKEYSDYENSYNLSELTPENGKIPILFKITSIVGYDVNKKTVLGDIK